SEPATVATTATIVPTTHLPVTRGAILDSIVISQSLPSDLPIRSLQMTTALSSRAPRAPRAGPAPRAPRPLLVRYRTDSHGRARQVTTRQTHTEQRRRVVTDSRCRIDERRRRARGRLTGNNDTRVDVEDVSDTGRPTRSIAPDTHVQNRCIYVRQLNRHLNLPPRTIRKGRSHASRGARARDGAARLCETRHRRII